MKISKRSWHYRLMREFIHWDHRMPTNLCRYARVLFLCVVLGVPFMVITYGTFTLIWYGLIVPGVWFKGLLPKRSGPPQPDDDGFPKFPDCDKKPSGSLSLVWDWLKAKKQKVCPLLEYVDD